MLVAMIDIDTDEILDLERDLERLRASGLRYATAATLTDTAFKARRLAHVAIGRQMIEKNTWTRRSVAVARARVAPIDRQEAEVGSTEGYMETQEMGGVERKKGKHGVPIPTAAAAGQGEANPRTRPVKAVNRLAKIRLARFRATGTDYKQRTIIAVNMAVRDKKPFSFMELGKKRRKGIYKITGGKYSGRGWPGKPKIKMHYDLSHTYVRIPRNPWLLPSAMLAVHFMPEMYERNLRKQLALFASK